MGSAHRSHAGIARSRQLRRANQALHVFYTEAWPRARTAALAAVVNEIAESGDPAAIEILHGAAAARRSCSRCSTPVVREGKASRLSWTGGASGARFSSRVSSALPRPMPAYRALRRGTARTWRSDHRVAIRGLPLVPIGPLDVAKARSGSADCHA